MDLLHGGTFVGLSAGGISSPVAQEMIELDSTTAAMTVSLLPSLTD
nr:hypothetical protein [Chroococcidiopsis cubana]